MHFRKPWPYFDLLYSLLSLRPMQGLTEPSPAPTSRRWLVLNKVNEILPAANLDVHGVRQTDGALRLLFEATAAQFTRRVAHQFGEPC